MGLAVAERPFSGPRLVLMPTGKSWGRVQEQKRFVERAGVVCVVRRRGGSLCLLGRMMVPKETNRGPGWRVQRPGFLLHFGEEEACMWMSKALDVRSMTFDFLTGALMNLVDFAMDPKGVARDT